MRDRRLASWGLLGKSPTVPVTASGSGELSRRDRWVFLDSSRLDEVSDVELARLDRDGHWKLLARKLPERLDLLLGRPSLSASFAPSWCELENGAVKEKLGKLGRALRQPEAL